MKHPKCKSTDCIDGKTLDFFATAKKWKGRIPTARTLWVIKDCGICKQYRKIDRLLNKLKCKKDGNNT